MAGTRFQGEIFQMQVRECSLNQGGMRLRLLYQ
jgi:hypothetical protein